MQKISSRFMVTCGILYCSTGISYASGVYGMLEFGYSKSNFDNVQASLPQDNTAVSSVVEDTDNSSFAAIGIGYDWDSKPWRAEVVYHNYGNQEFSDNTTWSSSGTQEQTTVEVKQESLMFNLLYDIDTDNNFTPYIGGGIGASKTKISATQVDTPQSTSSNRVANFAEYSNINLAWSLVAGINYDINDKALIGLGYRYTDAGEVSTDNNCTSTNGSICDTDETHSADLRMHSLFANLNYYF